MFYWLHWLCCWSAPQNLVSYHAHWREASSETSQPSGEESFGAGSATVNVSSLLLGAMPEKLDPVI